VHAGFPQTDWRPWYGQYVTATREAVEPLVGQRLAGQRLDQRGAVEQIGIGREEIFPPRAPDPEFLAKYSKIGMRSA
jgi:hypothetical protein